VGLLTWDVWRVVRCVVSGLVLMTATYYLLVAFDNITNPASNWVFVKGVLSGDGTPPNDGFEWREIHTSWFHVIAYVGVITGETLTGLSLAAAGFIGLRRAGSAPQWAATQRLTLLGCTIGLLVFFFGFISVGGNWFIMYLNGKWNGLEPAFQNSAMTAFTLLSVLIVLASDRLSSAEREPSVG
jgi:predicted small integral membrane protein